MRGYSHVDVDKYPDLSQQQKLFLAQIVPFAKYVQEQTVLKCNMEDNFVETENGIFTSITAASCIAVSDWGTSVQSQDRIEIGDEEGNWIHGNNLLHVKADTWWIKYCESIEYDGDFYKCFDDWGEFALDLSDRYSWKEDWSQVLKEKSVKSQLTLISLRQNNADEFYDRVMTILLKFRMWEFD